MKFIVSDFIGYDSFQNLKFVCINEKKCVCEGVTHCNSYCYCIYDLLYIIPVVYFRFVEKVFS